MSYAIFDLDIELPPVVVGRVRTDDGQTMYVARCEVCFKVTRPQPRISAAVRRQHHHGQQHAAEMLRRAAASAPVMAPPTRRDAA